MMIYYPFAKAAERQRLNKASEHALPQETVKNDGAIDS